MMCHLPKAARQLLMILVAFGTHHQSALQVSALPMYPSNSFAPSMKASVAASTVVAVTSPGSENDTRVEGECCVILTKSHVEIAGRRNGNGEGNADGDDGNDDDEADGVTLASVFAGSEEPSESINALLPEPKLYPIIQPGRHTPILSILSTGNDHLGSPPLLVAFTGFTPDVHHLSLRTAKEYLNHLHLYGGMPMRTDKVAKTLADVVRSEASSDGGRPFGVQALVVGDRPRSKQLQLYTIDPAGGCTHWSGGGTAIGKDAELVRKCLLRCLRPNGQLRKIITEDDSDADDRRAGETTITMRGTPTCWLDALDRAMMATAEASLSGDEDDTSLDDWLEEEGDGSGDFSSDRFRATVAFTTRPHSEAAAETKTFGVYSQVLEDSYRRCMQVLANEKMKKRNGRRKSSIR